MEFGLVLPQWDASLTRDTLTVARMAESAGYASLWAYERVLFPVNPSEGMYGIPGLAWDDGYRWTAETLTVLTAAAGVTTTVRLGTCVLVAGLHSAHELARTVATLDLVTGGGRVVLGLGGGWSSDEFRASGMDFAHRGRALDETIGAVRALWGPDPVTYSDSRMSVDNAFVSPKPLGRIPILIGGGASKAALTRIAREADGWIPTGVPVSVMKEQWKAIQDLAVAHGRDADAMRMVPLLHLGVTAQDLGADRQPFQGSVAQIVDDVATGMVGELGVGEAILALHGPTSTDVLTDQATRIMEALRVAELVS